MTYGKDNFPEIPDNWISILVGEAQETQGSFEKIKTKDYLDSGLFPIVDQGAKHIGGYSNDAEKIINKVGQVIVFGDHTRHIKYVDFPFIPGADGTKILHPGDFYHPKTFYYFLKAVDLPVRGYGRHFQFLRDSRIPLPPLAEQVRIADKLDNLLASVEVGRERLERVPKLLKRFRESVLSAAVSGELTREWRGGGDAFSGTSLAWIQISFGEAVSLINGDRGKNYPNRSEYLESGIPFINTGHIDEDGLLSKKRMNYISKDKFDQLNGGKIQEGDLVYCLRGATMGKTALVEPFREGAIASSLVIVRPKEKIISKYALYFLKSPQGKELIEDFDNGTAQPNLSAASLAQYTCPLPTLPEQAEIVRRVESLFSIADRIEAKYAAALSSFDRLTPALLAKAFRGKLVPQDPNDESASVLLERIQAQRAQEGTGAKRGRKPKATAPAEGEAPKRRGRPPKAESEGVEASEPKRRGRPPKVRADGSSVPQASSMEDAIRLLQERGQQRAEGNRQVSLFSEDVTS